MPDRHSKEDSLVWGTTTSGDTVSLLGEQQCCCEVELTLDRSLQLPAYSEMEVLVKAPGTVEDMSWILETVAQRGVLLLWYMLLSTLLRGESQFTS